ncbi:MAG: RagB/SusD family nutrient uptake outer membrane protein [Saprospiraceae bacterium]|nr:RagB/SusD family nutrient uptake outer membrane protein [Saprospiraceae bacterium]
MKKYNLFKILAAGFLLLTFNQSCTDLDEDLFSQVTEDNFFKTEEEFISALGAAYTSLRDYGGNGSIFSAQEVTSDEMVVPTRGNDWNDGGNWRALYLHTYGPETDNVRNTWPFLYGGVNACNRLIFQFENLEVEGKQAFISELKTLRALYYLWLMDIYGNVPIVDRFDVPDGFAPKNNTRAEVFAFVERELVQNIPNLSKDVDQSTYARMNFYAGQAVLANLYLNSEVYTGKAEWAKAVTACNEIINSGKYSLESNYFANFNTNNSSSKEFIFAIPYDRVFFGGFALPAMTLHYLSQETFNLTFQPWNGFCSLQEFYESYEDGDLRKGKPNTLAGPSGVRGNFLVGPQFSSGGVLLKDNDASAAADPDPVLNFNPVINQIQPNAYREAGARVGKFEFALGATQDLDNDFPVFRYADILLIKAEALWRQNAADAQALALVNQIRARAGVAPFTNLTADNLLAERGREMFAELKRRTDLIRFGKYNDARWSKPADPSKHVNIYPIPRAQLDANKSLVQNPGY